MAAGSTTAARTLLPVMCFVLMIVAVLQTLVVPIVGTIGAQLDVGPTAVGWLLTANLLAAATATPVLGRLADLRGKRPVLLGVLVVVLLGSLIGALSTSVGVLIPWAVHSPVRCSRPCSPASPSTERTSRPNRRT
ncbi:MFS transporter [Rhodococcus opacus]|uniref:MFS transporter n=1 Tax=Rhodococcus opacus TaxID=37919 RepID=UPI0029531E15|nr:MFS transporter [Rhodococcus opacus]MDV7088365.1 MFS transporter [Rhodococcus opacus]